MRIGIDVGATTVKAALCMQDGTILQKACQATVIGDTQGFLQSMKMLIQTLCMQGAIHLRDVSNIGIGLPGTLDIQRGMLLFGTNLGLEHVCLRDAFTGVYEGKVSIENDANCALLGEAKAGAARGMRHAVMLTLGTGLGGAILIDGKLYAGCNSIASEIGHMVIHAGGLPCNCGRRGCFEVYASATGLVQHAQRILARSKQESILRHKTLNGEMIFAAVDAGDTIAQQAFDAYIQDFACGTANIVNILQPDGIVIGGGLVGYGDKLLEPLRKAVYQSTFRATNSNTKILGAHLGNDAGLIGAALL